MAEKFLIDTSAVIKYLNESMPRNGLRFIDDVLNTESNISFITEIELQVWNPSNLDDLAVYKDFVANSNVIGVQNSIINQTIAIRRLYRLKLPDALIAATATVNNMTLIADNDSDFSRISELKIVNPLKMPTL